MSLGVNCSADGFCFLWYWSVSRVSLGFYKSKSPFNLTVYIYRISGQLTLHCGSIQIFCKDAVHFLLWSLRALLSRGARPGTLSTNLFLNVSMTKELAVGFRGIKKQMKHICQMIKRDHRCRKWTSGASMYISRTCYGLVNAKGKTESLSPLRAEDISHLLIYPEDATVKNILVGKITTWYSWV